MIARRMALALLAFTAVAGCKSSDEKLKDAQAFCRELATTWSERISTCMPFDRSFTDFEVSFMLDCAAIAKAQAEGTFTYDKAGAQACLDAFQAEPCTVVRRDGGPPDACQDAVVPKVAPGGDCWSGGLDLECVGGWCQVDEAACNVAGTCVAWLNEGADCSGGGACGPGLTCSGLICVVDIPPTVVGLGAQCGVGNVTCQPGLYCNFLADPLVCAATRTSGTCFDSSECSIGYQCQCTDATCTARACAPEKRVGATCTQGNQECVAGLWCDETSRCARFLGVGGDCGGMANGELALCLNGWCEPTMAIGRIASPAAARAAAPASAATGICRAFKALGALCDPAAGGFGHLQCGPGATCLGGTCVVSYCAAFLKT